MMIIILDLEKLITCKQAEAKGTEFFQEIIIFFKIDVGMGID